VIWITAAAAFWLHAVEYLPSSPTINRLKGSGSQSFWEWLLRKVGAGGSCSFSFWGQALVMLRQGLLELRNALRLDGLPRS
jgi:hypothetical protein